MFHPLLPKSILALTLSTVYLATLLAHDATSHKTESGSQAIGAAEPHASVRYKILDLGETDIDTRLLMNKGTHSSLAPVINNNGQVMGNRLEGGFLRDPVSGEWMPYINDVTIHFHDLSDKGDLLVSLNRKSNPPEWMIWPSSAGSMGPRQRIDIDSHQHKGEIYFSKLNDARMAVGAYIEKDKTEALPIFWRPNEDLQFIAEGDQKIAGQLQSLNNKGQLVGLLRKEDTLIPAVWSSEGGLQYMRNYRSKLSPSAEAHLEDILIAEDGSVYGTYEVKDSKDQGLSGDYTYAWLPFEGGGFKLLDLDNLKLSGLNDWHLLVGQYQGQAALCEPGKKPIALKELVRPSELEGWELIEATSINNWGDIVGYGKFNGNMHIFFLQNTQAQAPYR